MKQNFESFFLYKQLVIKEALGIPNRQKTTEEIPGAAKPLY